MITDEELVARATAALRPRELSPYAEAGSVASALVTAGGALHLGICIETKCGMGFCAEHAAIAAMVMAGESRIARIVAVNRQGRIIPPCGRCREFIFQIDPGNGATCVLLPEGQVKTIHELLPDHWAAGREARG